MGVFKPLIYIILEKAINRVLQLDPETLNRLQPLQGKVVKITFTDWQLDCFILIQDRGVKITGDYSGMVDTTIRGKLIGLIRAARTGGSGPALFEQGIEVVGDAELGEKIRDILRRVDLDGEEYLSRIVGDTAAHEIVWRTKRAIELGKQTWRGLSENIREFSQTEAQYLPSPAQVENLYSQISRLRDDVDRAALRVERLINKKVK
jgi:ubiquinone biosynthesis accessory factor UbiJ